MSNRKNAFTLVELLVVISIVAILISLLIPALAKARQRAMQVVCFANFKQLFTSHKMYMLDYKDKFLPSELSQGNLALTAQNDKRGAYVWGLGYLRRLTNQQYSNSTLEFNGNTDNSYVTRWKGVGRCPTASDEFIYSKHYSPTTYNFFLGTGRPAWIGVGETPLPGWLGNNFSMAHELRNYLNQKKINGIFREEDLKSSPDQVLVFADSIYSNRMNKNSADMYKALSINGGLHPGLNKLSILFVDGHVDGLDSLEWDNTAGTTKPLSRY